MAEESRLQSKVIDWLKYRGIYHFKVIGANKRGVPDLIACIDGRFVAMEFKSSHGTQSKLQKLHQQKIEEDGGLYLLVNPSNLTHSLNIIQSILYKRRLQ